MDLMGHLQKERVPGDGGAEGSRVAIESKTSGKFPLYYIGRAFQPPYAPNYVAAAVIVCGASARFCLTRGPGATARQRNQA